MEFHDYVNPVLLRQDVGRRLRCAREEVDLNVLDAAARLDIGASTVSRTETGRTQVSTALVQAMMRLYQLDDDELLDMVSRARRPGWWKQYGFADDHFIALESGASRLSTFQPDLIVSRSPSWGGRSPCATPRIPTVQCWWPPSPRSSRSDHDQGGFSWISGEGGAAVRGGAGGA